MNPGLFKQSDSSGPAVPSLAQRKQCRIKLSLDPGAVNYSVIWFVLVSSHLRTLVSSPVKWGDTISPV